MTQKISKTELKKRIYRVAQKRGYEVMESNLDTVINGLLKQFEKYGGYYCPCRVVPKSEKERKKIACPCIYLDEEIAANGICHCRLYKQKTS